MRKQSATKKVATKKAVAKKAAVKETAAKRPRRPLSMRHITRVDYERKHQHGWWVRIHRDGVMIHQFFSDARYKSHAAALRHAKVYRDDLLIKYPKPEHGNNFNRPNRGSKSGIAGVHQTMMTKDGIRYPVWQTSWVLPGGKRIVKQFTYSPQTRTEQEAKELAVAAREKGLRQIARIRRQLRKAEKLKAEQQSS